MPTNKLVAAFKSLLPNRPSTPSKTSALEALAEAVDRRERNSQDGGEMIRYLNETLGMSYREISDELAKLGRPMGKTAIGTWANKPPAD